MSAALQSVADAPSRLITGSIVRHRAALASVFAAHGHALFWWRASATGLAGCADADRIEAGGMARRKILSVDLAPRDACDRIDRELVERGLEPAIVVNNAGFGLFGEPASLDRSAQLAMIDLNVRALTDLSLRWVERLRASAAASSTSRRSRRSFPAPAWRSTMPPRPTWSR